MAAAAASALIRRSVGDARVRMLVFAYLFAATAVINPVSYGHAYPTLADRIAFAHSFGHNKAVVLFYGKAYDLLTIGGYSAWRVGGTLAILAAVFGLLAAVRALRAEEDGGRVELLLAGPLGREQAFAAAVAGITVQSTALWTATFAGSVAAGLPLGGSAYLSLAVISVVPVCAGVGAVASQVAGSRRVALELGGALIFAFFVLRVVADTSAHLGWLRWLTPLGWAEELRPFTGAQPAVLLLPFGAGALLLAGGAALARRRDVGSGIIRARDEAAPRLAMLGSPTQQALRSERISLLVWLGGVGAFAAIIGVISKSINSAGIPRALDRQLTKLGAGSVLTPKGYLAFSFIFFVLVVSMFMCSQVAGARHEEAEQRLDGLLALPVGRRNWLGGRLVLAVAGAVAISLCAGLLGWIGATSAGAGVSLVQMLEAGANCLPSALLFLGVAALAFSLWPRASIGIGYGTVTVAFLWELFGRLLGAPRWLVDLSPFRHVAAVPVASFRVGAAALMIGIGIACALAALQAFARRDLKTT